MKKFSMLLVGSLLLSLSISGLIASFGLQRAVASSSQPASPSFVRIIHASPYVGTADIFVDGAKLLSSFGFGSVTGYATIPAGPHKVQIALVGKGFGAAVLTQTLSVKPGFAYTVAAIGTRPNNLSLQVFVDNNLVSPGTVRFRVYQLSPDGGPVTVSTGGKTLLSGINYQNASSYLTVQAGAYTFNVLSSAKNAALTTATTLNANTIASLFVVGMFSSVPKSELVVSLTPGTPGMPNTGSDPNAPSPVQTTSFPDFWPWMLGIVLLLLITGGVFIRRATANH